MPIQRREPVDCPCRMSKNYLDRFGLCQVNYARQFIQSFPYFMVCKNEITVFIAIGNSMGNNQTYNW